MTALTNLPAIVQQAILSQSGNAMSDYQGCVFKQSQAVGYQGVWVAPDLCYDFRESNYSVYTVNLKKVAVLDVGPAMATAFVKIDPTQDAWIIVDGDTCDIDSQIFSCV